MGIILRSMAAEVEEGCEMWRMETTMQGWILWPHLPVLVSTNWLLLSVKHSPLNKAGPE